MTFCCTQLFLSSWTSPVPVVSWRGDLQRSLGTDVTTQLPANSPCHPPSDQGCCRPALARLGQAAPHKAHIYRPTHSTSSLSLWPQRKPSAQNSVFTLFWCMDKAPPFTAKQFWLIRSGRWMNTLLSVNHKSTLDKKTPDRTSLFSALTILSEISCLSRNWTATAEAVFVYFSKLCFRNINVKKLRIMGFKTPVFYSTCSLLWFLN